MLAPTEVKSCLTNVLSKTLYVDAEEVYKLLKRCSDPRIEFGNVDELHSKLLEVRPQLFDSSMKTTNGSISRKSQEAAENEILKAHAAIVAKFKTTDDVAHYLEQDASDGLTLRRQVWNAFGEHTYKLVSRFKEPDSIMYNIKTGNKRYTLADVIGFRIVPRYPSLFLEAVEKFERVFGDMVAFKLNIFSYTNQQLLQRVGPNSLFYRAIHYYIPTKPFCCEVQIRMHGVDLWSEVSHGTVYKPWIRISKKEEEAINELGRIANAADFFDLLRVGRWFARMFPKIVK